MSDEKASTSKKKDENKEEEKIDKSVESGEDESTMDAIQSSFISFFKKLTVNSTDSEDGPTEKIIDDLTLDGLGKHWKEKGFKNIITMVGAGISTSAGIPDFRSRGCGLYDNLQKYNLPHPSAIFEMDYFKKNPQPFFTLAKELYPGTFSPTLSHYFVRLLNDKGLLLRHYTQNIDTLERIAGIPEEKLVEAHGTFHTNHCIGCRQMYSMEWMKEKIFSGNVPTCEKCNSVVKPDIVFFGEGLPEKFYTLPEEDFEKCDLLIIMGTSLEVQPFASLVDRAGSRCVRLLINRTKVGHDFGEYNSFFMGRSGLQFDSELNTRDIAFIGDCDDAVRTLVDALHWREEFFNLVESELTRLGTSIKDAKINMSPTTSKEAKCEKKKAVDEKKENDRQKVKDRKEKKAETEKKHGSDNKKKTNAQTDTFKNAEPTL